MGNLDRQKEKTALVKYLCAACKLLARDAVQTRCGHYYCESCLSAICVVDRSASVFLCRAVDPCEGSGGGSGAGSGGGGVCGEWVNRCDCYDDWSVRRSVAGMAVSCKNEDEGCPWTGTVDESEAHANGDCEYEWVECASRGCRLRFMRIDLKRHLEYECPYRPKTCQYCNTVVTARDADKHRRDDCLGYPVGCPDCKIAPRLPRRDLPEHRDAVFGDCDAVRGPCPFSTLGCPVASPMARDDVRRHLDDEARRHSVLLLRQTMRSSGDGDEWKASWEERLRELMRRMKAVEDRCDRQAESAAAATASAVALREGESDYGKRCRQLEERVENHEVLFQELVSRLERVEKSLPSSSSSSPIPTEDRDVDSGYRKGKLIWRIGDVRKKRRLAREAENRRCCIYSPSFLVCKFGYKVRACAYMNGDGEARGTHLSLFLQVMRGDHDALLHWPFGFRVVFELLNQRRLGDVERDFGADVESRSFARPRSAMNPASGIRDFVELYKLDNTEHGFVCDDEMLVRVTVDKRCVRR